MKGRIKKYQNGVEDLAGFDKFTNFMGTHGGKISALAGTLKPLLTKRQDPNAQPYKKGSKLVKYDEGTKSTDTSKTGAIYFKGKLKGGEEKKTPVQNEKPKATQPSQEKEIKGFYQGSGLREYGATMGIPALAQTIPAKSRLGWLRNLIKFAPGAARFGSDVLSEAANPNVDVQWGARIGNLLKDIALGTTSTATVRTIGKTAEKLGQGYKAAARNTKNPTIPSVSKAVKESAPEALKASTVNKLATKVTGNENMIGNMMKANKNARNVKINTAAKEAGFTGIGDGKNLGAKGQYYYKGEAVTPEKYIDLSKQSNKEKLLPKKTKLKTTSKKVESSRQLKKSIEYRKDLEKAIEERESLRKGNVTVEGPNVQKSTPLQQDIPLRQRQGAEVERMREKGFTDKEGRTPTEFKNYYSQEKNRIQTQPKPSKMTDEEFKAKIESELEGLNKTKEAYAKGLAENKKAVAQKATAAQAPAETPKTEVAAETKTETKPASTRVRRQPASNTNKNQDVDAGKRESAAPTSTGRKRSNRKQSTDNKKVSNVTFDDKGKAQVEYSSEKASTGTARKKGGGESKEFSGRMPPGMIPGMPAGAKKKANGAKLIKYK